MADENLFKRALKFVGNATNSFISWDPKASNSAGEFKLSGPVRYTGTECLPTRYERLWIAGQMGTPGVVGDILNAAEATRMLVDREFELVGTNAASSCAAYHADGGILLTTTATANDQVIIAPHLTAGISAWTGVTWGTDDQTSWECDLQTGASITAVIIWAGLKLTNTPTAATDADQVYFRYQDGVTSGDWVCESSIGSTLTATDSKVAVAVSTRYHLKITIDASRIARFYINGALIFTTTALTDATDLIPYVGVQTTTTAAKTLRVLGQGISRAIK